MEQADMGGVCRAGTALEAAMARNRHTTSWHFLIGSTLALAALLAATSAASAAVEVNFVNPDSYTDAGTSYNGTGKGRDANLRQIASYLDKLGARYLAPDQVLHIDVLNVDLAGQFEPWRALALHVRFVRPTTWPRIEVRYTLSENGQVVKRADETVIDINYQMRAYSALSSDPLRYEKAMLDDWFKERFAPATH
jgi:hypothetical protein